MRGLTRRRIHPPCIILGKPGNIIQGGHKQRQCKERGHLGRSAVSVDMCKEKHTGGGECVVGVQYREGERDAVCVDLFKGRTHNKGGRQYNTRAVNATP